MQRPLLLAALALLALLVGAQGQVFYSDSIQFPTDFGQPSCMAHDPVSGVLYIVGSSSFYANRNYAAEYYGIQVMTATIDDTTGEVTTSLSGRLFDGIAGGCLLGQGAYADFLYIGTDGGAVVVVQLSTMRFLKSIQLGNGLPGSFVAGLTWVDNGLFEEFFALLSNPATLYRLTAELTPVSDTSETFFNLNTYPTRMTLPIVHDNARGIVMFPAFSLGNPSPFGDSNVNIVIFEDSLNNDSYIAQAVRLGVLPTPSDTFDYRPSAFYPLGQPYSYWALANYIVAVDHNTLELVPSNVSQPFVTDIQPVPGTSGTQAWALSSGDTDTTITLIDLPTPGNPVFNSTQVLNFAASNAPCGGWTWGALFTPATPTAPERYLFLTWVPDPVYFGSRTSFLCALSNTTAFDSFDIVPTPTYFDAGVYGIAAYVVHPNGNFYTCGFGVLKEWTFVTTGDRTLEPTNRQVPYGGFCWELILMADNNTLIFHDTNNVFTLQIDSWTLTIKNVMSFVRPNSAISWITYDAAKRLVYVAATEERVFFVDMSFPYQNVTAPLQGINLPPGFVNAQTILLDNLNEAIYIANCPGSGNASVIEMTVATNPALITTIRSIGKTGSSPCLGTASWVDVNTHRAFLVEASLVNPASLLFRNPGLRLNRTDAQPSAGYGAAIDIAGRQTWVLGRDPASASTLPRAVLWRRCWDNDTLGNDVKTVSQPPNVRPYEFVDGQSVSPSDTSFLVWDLLASPTILNYVTTITCPLINVVPPPPGTLRPPPNPTTFPNPPTLPPNGTSTAGRPTFTPAPILNDGKKGLSGGAIAGIVIFVIIFVGVAIAVIYYFITHRSAASGPSAAAVVSGTGAGAGSSGTAGAGGSAAQGASSADREGHQRFHDEDSGRF